MNLGISNHGLRSSGGIERYTLNLVRGLKQRNVKPTLIAKKFDPTLPEYRWVVPVHCDCRLAPAALRDLYFDWRIGRVKKRLGLYPLVGCNQTRWSDIGICGSTHPGYLEAMGQHAELRDRWKIRLERAHLENARIVVAHSIKMRDELIRHYGIDPAKIHVLYPPTDRAQFSPVDEARRAALRRGLGLPDDRAVFLLASTGHKRKGLDRLVDYFARTGRPATLVVAGRAMQATAANVRFLGYRADLENVYRAVDFTIVASRYEPFGLVGVESVLCGTPALLADDTGCAEVINENGKLAFARDAPESLDGAVAEAIERWQSNTARIASPLEALRYDPDVSAHLDGLLALASALPPSTPPRPGRP